MLRAAPLLLLAACHGPLLLGSPAFEIAAEEVDAFDLFEARVRAYDDARFSGRFQRAGEAAVEVEGFRDGDALRLRFMPSKFGEHVYALTLHVSGRAFEHRGTFKAKDVRRRGPVRVDKVNPWHFVWEGTGERFLWNGANGDDLPGLDDAGLKKALDRLVELRVTRVRLRAAAADERRLEAVVRQARARDVAVAILLDASTARWAVARLGGFSNVMWELPDAEAERLGLLVRELDPYDRLTTAVGREDFRHRRAAWVDVASHRSPTGGHAFVLWARREQAAVGRIMPQVVDASAGAAEAQRRFAWEVAMAGGYGEAGEPDAAVLAGRARVAEFLAGTEAARLEPRDELARNQGYVLAAPGRRYVLYQPEGRPATLALEPGRYRVRRFDPRTGAWEPQPPVEGSAWTAPEAPAAADWAWVLDRS
jgi:hypothetical protein